MNNFKEAMEKEIMIKQQEVIQLEEEVQQKDMETLRIAGEFNMLK